MPGYNADSAPYGGGTDLVMASSMIKPNPGGQPHDNMPPYLVTNFCIATEGVFPSRP